MEDERKYYLLELTTLSSGGEANGVFTHIGHDNAYSAYYSTISSKYVDANVSRSIIKLLDNLGNVELEQIVAKDNQGLN